MQKLLQLNIFLKLGIIGLVITLGLNLLITFLTGDSFDYFTYSIVWIVFITIGAGKMKKSGGK